MQEFDDIYGVRDRKFQNDVQSNGSCDLTSISKAFEKLDDKDVKILIAFYYSHDPHAFNGLIPETFPILSVKMKSSGVRLGDESLRHRVWKLVELGLLLQERGTYPSMYTPVRNGLVCDFIKEEIKRFANEFLV